MLSFIGKIGLARIGHDWAFDITIDYLHKIDLVFVGPETQLVDGLVDILEDNEIKENEVRKRLDKLKKDLAEIEVDGETIH